MSMGHSKTWVKHEFPRTDSWHAVACVPFLSCFHNPQMYLDKEQPVVEPGTGSYTTLFNLHPVLVKGHCLSPVNHGRGSGRGPELRPRQVQQLVDGPKDWA